MKNLGIVRGVAILFVMAGHAAVYGMTALGWWGHRFGRDVPAPDWSWVGTPTYYGLLGLNQLSLFAVPAFLFASAFFVVYAARGSAAKVSRQTVQGWIRALVFPYILWMAISLAMYAATVLLSPSGRVWDPLEFLRQRVTGYRFVLLLAEFYVLSPALVWLAFRWPAALLTGSALLMIVNATLRYLEFAGAPVTTLLQGLDLLGWLLPWQWTFFFALGLVIARYQEALRPHLEAWRRPLTAGVLALGMLSVAETCFLNGLIGKPTDVAPWTLSASLYTIAAILALFLYARRHHPLEQTVESIGAQSLGIYLVQPVAMEGLSRAAYHVAPWLLPNQALFQLLLMAVGLGFPLLAMAAVSRSRLRKYHRVLFGSAPAALARPRPRLALTEEPSPIPSKNGPRRLAVKERIPQ